MNNYLESQIDKLILKIDKMGYHAHKNNASRNFDGTYLAGEPYDYDLFLPEYCACFDAKMCQSKSYSIKDKDIKQINNLAKCKKAGMDSFFLIYFSTAKKLLKFDVDILIGILESGKKSINIEKGVKWDIDNKLLDIK
jgi:penicillin-binding protein-related factor A (putative recombinase)